MIVMKDLSFTYQGDGTHKEGIRQISLTIEDGECVLICGRSGCGKSTLIKLLNGLIPRYVPGEIEGELWIDGNRIDTYQMYELSKRLGSVFQNPRTQFFNVDVNSELVFGMENFAIAPEKMEERRKQVLQDLHLGGLAEHSIFELSGGEKQRVAFGSVYAFEPKYYLLDEPSSNLDAETIEQLSKYLKKVKEQKKNVIVAEHRLYYLMELVDRVLYMDNGEIVRDMTREEFLALTDPEIQRMGLRTRDILMARKEVQEKKAMQKELQKEFEVRGVSLERKKQVILSGIHLSAEKGDVIAVTGRNGVGKTTFIRYLCGLHKEGKGKVLLHGKELNAKERIKKAYIVMQDVNYQLFAESVLKECSFGHQTYEEEEVERLLKKFDLWKVRNKHPNTLSGGQKQRLAVISGCISNKEILIFDEPTSGLDYDSMHAMAEIIKTVAENRMVLVVTHDEEFIAKTCNKIIDLEEVRSET